MLSSNLYSNDDIECILRDFSVAEKLDIKALLSKHEHKKQEEKQKKTSKKYKIIMDNNKRVLEQKINLDLERIQYFKKLKKINGSVLNEISNFDTKYGKTKMKLKLLSIACKNNMENYIINLYLQIISVVDYKYSKKEKKLLDKVRRYMESINYKKKQFKELSNQLIPLDFYNTYALTLDDWQLEVIKGINHGKSILVSAPTSCGKTWISLYPGILKKKILFIVPTEALVYQVGALFSKFVSQPTLISDNIVYVPDNSDIIIGTPRAIEEKLPVLDIDFDIIIIDEIHNLNNLGIHHYYERLLKIFSNKQLLALSATIGDPDSLVNWLQEIGYKNINLILYTTRFLNLQRQVFLNGSLEKIHPISCLTIDDINKNFLTSNLPMTPYDTIVLYETLLEYFPEEVGGLDINKVFPEKNKRLSLEDSRIYEGLLKEKLIELKKIDEGAMARVLEEYKIEDKENYGDNINLYNLFREIKNKKLTPCIVFQENTNHCKEIFETLVHYLEKLETLNYPHYYENLEYQQQQYLGSKNQIEKFKEQIKLGKDVSNPKDIIEERVFGKEQELNKLFLENYTKRINKQILIIQKSDIKENIKKVQINNLEIELETFSQNCKLHYIDVFKKHIDFSLNSDSPMTATTIREIKKTISKQLNINVSYTNVFIQGLKRGVGIYTKHMPFIYNLIVQKLAQNGELGFVVADDRLALGINMPFRSSCILGFNGDNTFKIDNYIQMIGRAGRRGKDKEGHIIFANVDWKYLMKSELTSIVSPYKHVPNYKILSHLTPAYNKTIDKVFQYSMNGADTGGIPGDIKIYDKKFLNIIVWKLKLYYDKVINFCNHITNINKILSFETNHTSLHNLIKIFSEYFLDTHKYETLSKALNHTIEIDALITKTIHEYIYIIKSIYNSVYGYEGHNLKKLLCQLKYSYEIFIDILNKSCDLN